MFIEVNLFAAQVKRCVSRLTGKYMTLLILMISLLTYLPSQAANFHPTKVLDDTGV